MGFKCVWVFFLGVENAFPFSLKVFLVVVLVLLDGGLVMVAKGINLNRFILAPEGTVQAACQQDSDQLYDSQSDTDAGQDERL